MGDEQTDKLEDNPPYVTPELQVMLHAVDTKKPVGVELPGGTIREDH